MAGQDNICMIGSQGPEWQEGQWSERKQNFSRVKW